ncbi:hypothetical protein [Chromatocurvus halotolerans]|uniref:hypothetical protein n=1 Tax=Chromatocurvus halotolerans TaxID=1132028 RepID=UPI0013C2C215|nr:hypothetical protein [Chromatocurvus halotolerans]
MESVAAFAWNGWQASSGISGRLGLEYASAQPCETDSVKITGIYENNGSININNPIGFRSGAALSSYPISSTSCLGFITDPNNAWGKSPSPNVGDLYDGLLNGQIGGTGNTDYYIDPNQFLTNDNDAWVDATTPGWIMLAQSEVTSNGEWINDSSYKDVNEYNLNQFIDLSFNNNGEWSLLVDPGAIDGATQALGRPAVFDHLTFVLKGSNSAEAPWAIFDFNFWDLLDAGLDISLGDTAYYFTGSWQPNVVNGQELSNVGIWAHDPLFSITQVSAPGTLWLIGLVMVFAGGTLRGRSSKISDGGWRKSSYQ